MTSAKNNPNQILLSFVCFFAGMLACFVALNHMIVKPHAEKTNRIVHTVVQDAKKLEKYGALTMVTQCKELGYAFVAADDETGYVIDCGMATVAEVSGEKFAAHQGQFEQFSSKLSDRPLVTTSLEK